MNMTISELISAIESHPRNLYEALSEVEKAEKAIEKLNEQIEEEEFRLSPDESSSLGEPNATDHQDALFEIEYEIALLDLAHDKLKGEVELEYRHHPPEGEKVTEATVAAIVKSDDRLFAAKNRCLSKKHERDALVFAERSERMSKRVEAKSPVVTSPKLEKLREKLLVAESVSAIAEMKVEEVKASILSYQLLVQVYTSGLEVGSMQKAIREK